MAVEAVQAARTAKVENFMMLVDFLLLESEEFVCFVVGVVVLFNFFVL